MLGFSLVGQKKCAMMLHLYALQDRQIVYILRRLALTGDSWPFMFKTWLLAVTVVDVVAVVVAVVVGSVAS